MGKSGTNGYSAKVELTLLVEGRELSVAKVGPDSLMLQHPTAIAPSTTAELVMKFDGISESQSVLLFEGATAENGRVRFF